MENKITWPDGANITVSKSFEKAVYFLNENMNTVADVMKIQARRGGILEPNYIKAVKSMLWFIKHKAEGEALFQGYRPTGHLEAFEETFSAVLLGSLSEDGIFTEGGSYKHNIAPFSGQVPSLLLETAADAIEYYRLTNNTVQEDKWIGLAEGMYRTCTGLYEHAGGYPYSTVFTTSNAPGDLGSVPLGGFLKVLGQRPSAFTDVEGKAITGGFTDRY
jgi:hypothetical protein